MSCIEQCCLLLRGQVFIQAAGEFPRLIGNASRLEIAHVKNDIVPLDGSLSVCDPIDAMSVSITMKCADIQNMSLAVHGNRINQASNQVTEAVVLPDSLEPGQLIPFSGFADVKTVKVTHDWLNTSNGQKFRAGTEYTITPIGLEINKCVTVPTVSPSNKTISITYKTIDSTRTDAGEGQQPDVTLIYMAKNQFDGTDVIVRIPQVRFDPMDGFGLVNDTEIDLSITGDIIRQETSPNWYNLTRPSTGC